jgi:hypothetical protein
LRLCGRDAAKELWYILGDTNFGKSKPRVF